MATIRSICPSHPLSILWLLLVALISACSGRLSSATYDAVLSRDAAVGNASYTIVAHVPQMPRSARAP